MGKKYFLVIGPFDEVEDGFTIEDRKEWLEDVGYKNVKIEHLECPLCSVKPAEIKDAQKQQIVP